MQSNLTKLILMGVTYLSLALPASANLLINPTRIVFSPTDRTTDVTLINISKTTNTYRIGWMEKKAKSVGGYEDLTPEAAAAFPVASTMIRYSPKQVTLKAGERQTIKMAIRRPQGLATGEYRSHLLFKALPPMGPLTLEKTNQDQATKVNILLNFAIPVVVQQGTIDYQVALKDAVIGFDSNKNEGSVTVNMTRSGANSVIGNIDAYWTPDGGKEQVIGKSGDFNFWPELNNTQTKLTWVGTGFAKTDGKLRIVYEGTKDFRGKVFFDNTIHINRSMIK